jgi:hypothetical protein
LRIYDTKVGRRLMAAVEIVSPANKDRPEHRRAFVARCAALLQSHVCVTIVDLVTTRDFNLYSDLIDQLGLTDRSFASGLPPLYVVTSRWSRRQEKWLMESWSHALARGASPWEMDPE